MAIFTVTTANDVVNAGDGLTLLREAITLANTATDADTLVDIDDDYLKISGN